MNADIWRCSDCQRSSVVCPLRDDQAYDKAHKIFKDNQEDVESSSIPLPYLMERLGVCPRSFITPLVSRVLQARTWFETGQLGISYLEAPEWIPDAMSILNSEINQAQNLKREMERKERTAIRQEPARIGRR